MLKEKINSSELTLECFEELKKDYPEFQSFFDNNREELLFLMEDIQSERELHIPTGQIEVFSVSSRLSYDYPSSSVYAAEDLLIELIDAKRDLLRGVLKVYEDQEG